MKFISVFVKIVSLPIVLIVLLYWVFYIRPEQVMADHFQDIKSDFLNQKSKYLQQLIDARASTGVRPQMSFVLLQDDGSAVGANVFEYLIYDESDEIAREPSERTEIWNRAAERQLRGVVEGSCRVSVSHLGDHVYAAISTC